MKITRPDYIEEILLEKDYSKLIDANSGKAVVLLSGGIDSTVALLLAKSSGLKTVGLEFFYDGRPIKETTMVEEICDLTKTALFRVSYPFIEGQNGPGLSESNSIYYSIASGFAEKRGIDYIVSGQILNDWTILNGQPLSKWGEIQNTRSTPRHYNLLNKLLRSEDNLNPIKILTPLIYLNKKEVVEIGLSLDAPLDLTWSCEESGEIPCEKCTQCNERADAFSSI